MRTRIHGRKGGSYYEGGCLSHDIQEKRLTDDIRRPYLHMYKHSNEIEEVAVVNLNGVNIESNPEMEALLGVSLFLYIALFHRSD